jgi:sulfatase maturation enzyme AslB (radical SAM superfamily)
MANQQIFCNTPWYEAHIYWDGSLGICCQESRKIHSDEARYNIKNMTLRDWFNSDPVKQLRKTVLSNTPTDICSRCYNEERLGGTSRRHRANQKSVIFTRTAFTDSYDQSPGYPHFNLSDNQDGFTDTLPIDLHIDLGNYCNLACKMCWSGASSTIAVQNVRWGVEDHRQYLGNDWTGDSVVWDRFLNELITIPKLKNLHFMGGETLLTKKFEDLVDFFIAHNRFDICFSFVTNGTTFNESLINKLKKFTRVGIEVSIETTTEHNSYVRQGTDTTVVLENIQKYITYCTNSSISVTVRPAISALTVGYYYTLLEYCLEHKLLIKSLIVTSPTWLDANILPDHVKQLYKISYQTLLNKLELVDTGADYNESDTNNYIHSIVMQAKQAIRILEQNNPTNQQQEWSNLIEHCRKWDSVYKLDGLSLYPELAEIFKKHGY